MNKYFLFFSKPFYIALIYLIPFSSHSQCNQNYDWTTWSNFAGSTATGTIWWNSQNINVTMTCNFTFNSTPTIWGYSLFNNFSAVIPNTTVPRTTWAVGAGGTTTMCFSQQVSNPVLVLASLGSTNIPVTLSFSLPYVLVYDGGGMNYTSSTSIYGHEGFAVIMFPGTFNCVTIFSTTPEYYTNLTWGLNPPLFPVTITEVQSNCTTVTLSASGGETYSWSGGMYPDSAVNVFDSSGTYILTVTDSNGCIVTTSQDITLGFATSTTVNISICSGTSYEGHNAAGTFIDTIPGINGCDTIRTLNLSVYPLSPQSIVQQGDSLISYQGFLNYQWYWNGNLIPGATNYSYLADQNGTYSVACVDTNGCELEAVIINVITGISEEGGQLALLTEGSAGLAIYPNPVTSYLKITADQISIAKMEICNVIGERLFTEKYDAAKKDITLSTDDLQRGIYFIKIETDKGVVVKKFMKE